MSACHVKHLLTKKDLKPLKTFTKALGRVDVMMFSVLMDATFQLLFVCHVVASDHFCSLSTLKDAFGANEDNLTPYYLLKAENAPACSKACVDIAQQPKKTFQTFSAVTGTCRCFSSEAQPLIDYSHSPSLTNVYLTYNR